LYYLDKNELYETTKPYNILYYLKEDFPRHNLHNLRCITLVKNMRAHVPPVSLDTVGFELYRLNTKMESSDFYDDAKVEHIYCRELENYVLKALGAKNVRALDFQVSKTVLAFVSCQTDVL
jgi:hypothetical protein